MVIDVFCHHSTNQLENMIGQAFARQEAKGQGIGWNPQAQFPFPVEMTTAESRLRIMEEYAIDMQDSDCYNAITNTIGGKDLWMSMCYRKNINSFWGKLTGCVENIFNDMGQDYIGQYGNTIMGKFLKK